ncbi:MAG TPA: anthranilate phosphoribosyltransferase [Alphaproteobacteria bacterium]|nr:anthranilate phosphoribosyltransferase [Alphaproteobacteria bacterium]
MSDFKTLLAHVATGAPLNLAQARQAFEIMMSGDATPAQIGGFLMALRVRGETVDEITAAASVMREKVLRVDAPMDAIDTCGTGGDASGTFNISTAAAFVVAACGVPVAKHGNRALSSKTGSAEVLMALGVNIETSPELVSECVRKAGLGFMMAPRHHGAMKYVGPTRVELGTRTIFNLLGPLSNPAGAKRQLIGVFARQWVEPLARVLANLGAERAWVAHGSDGLDELTTTGPSYVCALENGQVRNFEVTPADAGLALAQPVDLLGGDSEANANAIRDLLAGVKGPYRDIVLLNAAAALIVAGKAVDLKAGVALGADAIDSGGAAKVLERLIAISNGKAAS